MTIMAAASRMRPKLFRVLSRCHCRRCPLVSQLRADAWMVEMFAILWFGKAAILSNLVKQNVIVQELISSFEAYLKFEKRYSEHTIRGYGDDLSAFFDYIQVEFGIAGLAEISPAVVRSWLASLKDGGLSSRSIVRKISTLRSFYKFQLRQGGVEVSPMAAIIAPKVSKRLPVFVEKGDIAV